MPLAVRGLETAAVWATPIACQEREADRSGIHLSRACCLTHFPVSSYVARSPRNVSWGWFGSIGRLVPRIFQDNRSFVVLSNSDFSRTLGFTVCLEHSTSGRFSFTRGSRIPSDLPETRYQAPPLSRHPSGLTQSSPMPSMPSTPCPSPSIPHVYTHKDAFIAHQTPSQSVRTSERNPNDVIRP